MDTHNGRHRQEPKRIQKNKDSETPERVQERFEGACIPSRDVQKITVGDPKHLRDDHETVYAIVFPEGTPSIFPEGTSFVLLKSLGKGANGKVYSAVSHDQFINDQFINDCGADGQCHDYMGLPKGVERVAIKTVKLENKSVHTEFAALTALPLHRHVIAFKGAFTSYEPMLDRYNRPQAGCPPKEASLVMELVDHDLRYFTASYKLTYMQLMVAMKQSLAGVAHLHENNYVHMDLKDVNLGLRDGEIKLLDLGFTHPVAQAKRYRGHGTRRFMAPEVLLKKTHSKAADIWSLGIVFVEWLTGHALIGNEVSRAHALKMMLRLVGVPTEGWAHKEAASDLLQTLNGDHTSTKKLKFKDFDDFPDPEGFPLGKLLDTYRVPKGVIDLVQRMLQADPAKRITAEEALQSSAMGGVDATTSILGNLEPRPLKELAQFNAEPLYNDNGLCNRTYKSVPLRHIDDPRHLFGTCPHHVHSQGVATPMHQLLEAFRQTRQAREAEYHEVCQLYIKQFANGSRRNFPVYRTGPARAAAGPVAPPAPPAPQHPSHNNQRRGAPTMGDFRQSPRRSPSARSPHQYVRRDEQARLNDARQERMHLRAEAAEQQQQKEQEIQEQQMAVQRLVQRQPERLVESTSKEKETQAVRGAGLDLQCYPSFLLPDSDAPLAFPRDLTTEQRMVEARELTNFALDHVARRKEMTEAEASLRVFTALHLVTTRARHRGFRNRDCPPPFTAPPAMDATNFVSVYNYFLELMASYLLPIGDVRVVLMLALGGRWQSPEWDRMAAWRDAQMAAAQVAAQAAAQAPMAGGVAEEKGHHSDMASNMSISEPSQVPEADKMDDAAAAQVEDKGEAEDMEQDQAAKGSDQTPRQTKGQKRGRSSEDEGKGSDGEGAGGQGGKRRRDMSKSHASALPSHAPNAFDDFDLEDFRDLLPDGPSEAEGAKKQRGQAEAAEVDKQDAQHGVKEPPAPNAFDDFDLEDYSDLLPDGPNDHGEKRKLDATQAEGSDGDEGAPKKRKGEAASAAEHRADAPPVQDKKEKQVVDLGATSYTDDEEEARGSKRKACNDSYSDEEEAILDESATKKAESAEEVEDSDESASEDEEEEEEVEEVEEEVEEEEVEDSDESASEDDEEEAEEAAVVAVVAVVAAANEPTRRSTRKRTQRVLYSDLSNVRPGHFSDEGVSGGAVKRARHG